MLPGTSRFCRIVHIATAVFVLSYVFFQVLDLDLSNFPLKHVPENRALALVESTETIQIAQVISEDSLRFAVVQLPKSLEDAMVLQQRSLFHTALPRPVQIQLHRLKMPRSSAPDAAPVA